jgi:hypothetical protein
VNVAVLSLTRDRLDYTRHCFATLRAFAGCDYDHYVLDQGSQDETVDWLKGRVHWIEALPENIGISRGMNRLLGLIDRHYDVIVKIDNDCELTQPKTLKTVCELALSHNAMLSPVVKGLIHPPVPQEFVDLGGWRIGKLGQIGGIFAAVPATFYRQFRFDETNPTWGMDDAQMCHEFTGTVGYVMDFSVRHFESTVGQHKRYGWYFDRRVQEGGPA